MIYLQDTNACVNLLKIKSASRIAQRLAQTLPSDVILCSIVRAELMFGAMQSRDISKNLADVASFTAGFNSFPFDDAAADTYGQIRAHLAKVGTPIGPNDLLIASIALANKLTLVTHNTREFSRVPGLQLDDWEA